MQRRRHWAALLIFICALVAVGYLWLINYIKDEIVDALNDEARQACECSFKVDDLDISLLTLQGTARNARLISKQDGKPKLAFAKLESSFGLEQIFDHKVIIQDLRLIDGYAIGYDEDSVLYRFIDQLSAKPPPGHVSTSLIKARLKSLQVVNANLEQTFPGNKILRADKVSMNVYRDEAGDVHLEPVAEKFYLQTNSTEINFGKLSGNVVIKDNNVEFESMTISRLHDYLSAQAETVISQGNQMNGSLQFNLDNQNFGIDAVEFSLTGSGQLSGRLATPTIAINLDHDVRQLVSIESLDHQIFTPIEFGLTLNVFHGSIDGTVTQFKTANNLADISLDKPVNFSLDKLEGAIKIVINHLQLGDAEINGSDLTLLAHGSLSDPTITLQGDISEIKASGVSLRDIKAEVQSNFSDLHFKFSKAQQFIVAADYNINAKTLENGTISLNQLAFSELGLGQNASGRVDYKANFSGPAVLDKLEVDGSGELFLSKNVALKLKTALSQSKLNISVNDLAGSVSLNGKIGLQQDAEVKIEGSLLEFDFSSFGIPCGKISSKLQYDADPTDFLLGQGNLEISSLKLGCGDSSFVLMQPTSLALGKGELSIKDINLRSFASTVRVQGSLGVDRGYNLGVDADLKLSELIQFIPQGDELQGSVHASATIKGPYAQPEIAGSGNLRNGELTIEAADISITDTNADFTINGSEFFLNKLEGEANGGSFNLSGEIPLLKTQDAHISASFEDILIQTIPDTTIYFAGKLDAHNGSRGLPEVSGQVVVSNAEYQRNIDLAAVVASVRKFFSGGRERAASQITARSNEDLPDIDLQIDLTAPRNIFVITNFAEAEFRSTLKLSGTVKAPVLAGKVEALSMWFGLGDKRFEVNSAELRFRPDSFEPNIDLVSEGVFHARSGETSLVVLEAHGAVSNPRITLSSDRGLSEQQILNLITTGFGDSYSYNSGSVAGPIKGSSIYLLEGVPFVPFESFFKDLTTINSLNLEPRFNSQTAGIDPTVVATKDLNSRLTLIGESSFGGIASEARAKLRLELSDRLNIAGIIESANSRSRSSVGTDLTYTVLSGTRKFVEIDISGNRHFSDRSLLRALRVGESTKLPEAELPVVKSTLEKFYRDQGYLGIKSEITCQASGEFCRALQIKLYEGPLAYLDGVQIVGDSVPENIEVPDDVSDEVVTADYLNGISADLLKQLRNEGYIRARLKSELQVSSSPDRYILKINLQLGSPVSFNFIGNKQFSASDFLDSINLFERRQPFGSNTINILVRNIESLYQRAGYFDAKISWSEVDQGDDKRTNYRIEIIEGEQAKINGVRFYGLDNLSLDELMRFVDSLPEEQRKSIRKPKRALPEDLSSNSEVLRNLLVEHGFADASVNAQLEHLSIDEVTIAYTLTTGVRTLGPRLVVKGLPADVEAVAPLEPPYSAKRLNRIIDGVVESLSDAGYMHASLSSQTLSDVENTLVLEVEPGEQTKIGQLYIEGLSSVPESTVRESLTIQSGSALTRSAIEESKLRIIRSGLFSRVEIMPVNDDVDSPVRDLKIKVNERVLHSLSVGIGANSELGLHLFSEGSDRSLFKDGRTLSLRLDSYYNDLAGQISEGSANLQFLVPQALGSDFTYTADGRFIKQQDITLPYDLDRVSLANFLYRSFESGETISAGHTILGEDLSDVAQGTILGDHDSGFDRLGFLTAAATLERRDDPLTPNKGYALSLENRLAAHEFGSNADYFSSNLHAALLLPVSETPWRFSLLGRAAAAWPFGSTNEIPLSQRYFLGGRTSIRGFGENSIGPRNVNDVQTGGDISISDTLEAHYLFANSFYALTFLDSGNVFLHESDVNLSNLRWSSGVGARYVSPIGPIGIDIGAPLDREPGESTFRIHFNIGSGF